MKIFTATWTDLYFDHERSISVLNTCYNPDWFEVCIIITLEELLSITGQYCGSGCYSPSWDVAMLDVIQSHKNKSIEEGCTNYLTMFFGKMFYKSVMIIKINLKKLYPSLNTDIYWVI